MAVAVEGRSSAIFVLSSTWTTETRSYSTCGTVPQPETVPLYLYIYIDRYIYIGICYFTVNAPH